MEGGASSSSSLVAGKGRGRGRFVRVEHMAMADEEGPQVKELDHEQTSTGGVEDDKESSSMEAVHETAIHNIGDLSHEVRLTKRVLDNLAQKHPEEIAKLVDEFKKKINPHAPGSSDEEYLKLIYEELLEDEVRAVKKRVADLIALSEVDQDVEAATNLISIKAEFVEKMNGIINLYTKGLMDYETLEKEHQKIRRDLLQCFDMKVKENFEVDGAPPQLRVELQTFLNGYSRGLRVVKEMEECIANCCNQKNQNQALEKVEKKPEEELEH